MFREIERKFLVNGDFKSQAFNKTQITQGYLSSVPERSVRVRVKGDRAYLTVKGKGNATGANRFEWEKEISVGEAEALLQICEPGIINKTRYYVKADKFTYEIDEFHGGNEGLILAEIELEDENDTFPKPEWIGEEVTGKRKYYNSMLSKHPFSEW
ncbi:CYTH domain-containing protein [Sanguibacteroides justesenii]|uniref:Adenylate cyclase n=1 Tax=Sanguibacteroides justesenii TaxID=1547597 RepID=A0A0C3RI49_9PORP|nr:CYTH domain-containing protein [Sanguibacteroides justesenii]KIO43381.1 adenylate cyclase [Sanguibacteroides justesenii]KIO45559.1 adenylate cyclase [Sanguibacteroides justesenii]